MKNKEKSNPVLKIVLCIIIATIGYAVYLNYDESKNKNLEENNVSEKEEIEKTRTIMIYMSASDLESKNNHATKDLNSLDATKIKNEDMNVIVIAGGTNKWNNDFSKETSIYELSTSGYTKKETIPKEYYNMGKQETLTYFLDYVQVNYPSDVYDLFMWGHGLGMNGLMYDEIYDDWLDPWELIYGIHDSKLKGAGIYPIETTILMSCYSATIEVASSLSGKSQYLVASELASWNTSDKSNISFINDIKKEDDGVSLGKKFIDNYSNNIINTPVLAKYDHNMALIETSSYSSNSVDLSKILNNIDIKKDYNNLINLRKKMKVLDLEDSYNDVVDLYSLVEDLCNYNTESCNKLKSKWNYSILYNWTTNNNLHGISIYYPYYSDKNDLAVPTFFVTNEYDINYGGTFGNFFKEIERIQLEKIK